jgi:predicted dehydrogenase
MSSLSRRSFIQAGASLAPFARVRGANDAIRVGIVGVGSTVRIGGKGKVDARDFAKIPGVRVAAFCDVDHANLDPEVQKWRDRGEKVEAYTDVRKLLENRDIDVVSVTPPNHWHALVTVWACQAGKDVFVQKPASHNLFEGRKMVEAAAKYKRIVQCPSNSRSPNGVMEAMEWARQGNLGKIRFVHGVNYAARTSIGKVAGAQPIPKSIDYDLWSGPAPVLPLMRENLHYDWHWQWHYGDGELGNWGPHILDGCRMAIDAKTMPRHVIACGGRFGYTDDGQTPNSQLMFYDFQPAPVIFEIRGLPRDKSFLASAWDKNQAATMDSYCGIRQGTVVHCEGGYVAQNKAFDQDGKLIRQFQPTSPNLNVNFIEAVRSRKAGDLVSPILEGHETVALIHASNISYRVGKTLSAGEIKERIGGNNDMVEAFGSFQEHLKVNDVDVDKMIAGPMLAIDPAGERFTGDFSAEANQLARGEYRKPFIVPEKV